MQVEWLRLSQRPGGGGGYADGPTSVEDRLVHGAGLELCYTWEGCLVKFYLKILLYNILHKPYVKFC